MNTAYFAEIERLLRTKFTGKIVLHVNQGTVKGVDTEAKIRLHPDGAVSLNERKGVG